MRKLSLLLFALTIVVGASAFASSDKDAKNEGTKIELSTGNKVESVNLVIPDFNLNTDLIKLVQIPDCGSPEHTGWEFSHYQYTNTAVYRVDTRSCIETLTIYWPWGVQVIEYQTTESRSYPMPLEY